MFFFGFQIFQGVLGLLLLPLAIFAGYWTWKDAADRNLFPWLWASLSFTIFPVGFLVYLIYRSFLINRNKL